MIYAFAPFGEGVLGNVPAPKAEVDAMMETISKATIDFIDFSFGLRLFKVRFR